MTDNSLYEQGAAFPHPRMQDSMFDTAIIENTGLTKRDAFAIGALPGVIEKYKGTENQWADMAYRIADAMIQRRKRFPGD